MRRSRRLRAERGGFAGGGVRYGFTTERKQLVPDQAEQEVARRIRRLHRGGLSIRRIADKLNTEQIPAKRGGPWHPTTVARVLRRTPRGSSCMVRPVGALEPLAGKGRPASGGRIV
ncbi:MAG TPA: recombinase family protein [Actinomycetes bacterium]|nr:recombinase family protein [Actinomycetes bacterium]